MRLEYPLRIDTSTTNRRLGHNILRSAHFGCKNENANLRQNTCENRVFRPPSSFDFRGMKESGKNFDLPRNSHAFSAHQRMSCREKNPIGRQPSRLSGQTAVLGCRDRPEALSAMTGEDARLPRHATFFTVLKMSSSASADTRCRRFSLLEIRGPFTGNILRGCTESLFHTISQR